MQGRLSNSIQGVDCPIVYKLSSPGLTVVVVVVELSPIFIEDKSGQHNVRWFTKM